MSTTEQKRTVIEIDELFHGDHIYSVMGGVEYDEYHAPATRLDPEEWAIEITDTDLLIVRECNAEGDDSKMRVLHIKSMEYAEVLEVATTKIQEGLEDGTYE